MNVESLVLKGKQWINCNDLSSLITFWEDLQKTLLNQIKDNESNEGNEYPESFDWPTVFQTLYLHACLKGKSEIATWFQTTVFSCLDPIQQIALRQSFAYGKHLLATAARRREGKA